MHQMRFGTLRALSQTMDMDNEKNNSLEQEGWRKRCKLIVAERDPQRMSELLEQLLGELDICREKIRQRKQ